MLEDAEITCPYCWETLTLEVDLSGGSAEYVEDCQVCCQPILVRLRVDGETGEFRVEASAEND